MIQDRSSLTFKLLILSVLMLSIQGCGWIAIGGGAAAIASSGGGGGGGGVQFTTPQVQVSAALSNNQQMGDIPVDFTLTDAESSATNVEVEYSIAGGTFLPCTAAAGSIALTELTSSPDGVDHQFVWSAATDITNAEEESVVVRVTVKEVADEDLQSDDSSSVFRVGNQPPTISNIRILEVDNIIDGSVVVEFTVTDTLGDEVGLNQYEYSTDNGMTWLQMTDNAITGGIKRGLALATMKNMPTIADFTWDTQLEAELRSKVILNRLLIRLTPEDTYEQVKFTGAAGLIGAPVTVDNNSLPEVQLLFDGISDTSSPVVLPFVVSDDDDDEVKVIVQWKSASQASFIDLNDPALNELLDPNDPDRDELSDPLVFDALLSDVDLRKRLQIITEVETQTLRSVVSEPSDLSNLNLRDLAGRVRAEDLVNAGISLDNGLTTIARITSYTGTNAQLDTVLQSVPVGQTVSVIVALPTQKDTAFPSAGRLPTDDDGQLHELVWNAAADFFGPVNAQLRMTPIDLRQGDTSESFRADFNIQGQLQNSNPNTPGLAPGGLRTFQVQLDKDGDNDLIVIGRGANSGAVQSSVSILNNDGGQFVSAKQFPAVLSDLPAIVIAGEITDFVPVDMNGDQLNDLVFIIRDQQNADNDKIQLVFQQGTGSDGNIFFDSSGSNGTSVALELSEFVDLNADKIFLGFSVQRMDIADFNGDGLPDIALGLSSMMENKLVILYRNSPSPIVDSSSFSVEELENIALTIDPQATDLRQFVVAQVTAADVNQDGMRDLVVHYQDNTFNPPNSVIAVHLQSINTTSTTSPGLPGSATSSATVAAATTMGFSHVDFQPVTFEIFDSIFGFVDFKQFVVSDFDSDGIASIAFANGGAGNVLIIDIDLANVVGPVLTVAAELQTGEIPEFISFGDINGDGLVDLVTSNPGSQTVSLFLQSPKETGVPVDPDADLFVEAAGSPLLVKRNSRGLSVGPLLLNNPTIVVASSSSGLTFLEQPLTTVIREVADSVIPPAESAGLTINDFNGDGRLDIAFSSVVGGDDGQGNFVDEGTLQFFSQDPFGNFINVSQTPLFVGDDPGQLESADFNFDGTADVALITSSSMKIVELFPDNQGATASISTFPITDVQGGKIQTPITLSVGDFNSDGRSDLIVLAEGGSPTVSVFLQDATTNQIAEAPFSPLGLNQLQSVNDMAVGDINGDGRDDIVIAGDRTIIAFLQLSTGSFDFTSPVTVMNDGEVTFQSITIADVGGDGLSDVVATAQRFSQSTDDPVTFSVFVADQKVINEPGDKLFDLVERVGTFLGTTGIVIAGDLNSDGLTDLAFQRSTSSIRVLFQGIAEGNKREFVNGTNFDGGLGLSKFLVGDMNRDGLDDLVIYSSAEFFDPATFEEGANRVTVLQQD